jgi:uncharacterized protein (DUF488 family)
MNLLTLGHGTMSEEEFIDLVCGIGVSRVVDIRSVPGSRHNSQFGRADMEGGCQRPALNTAGKRRWVVFVRLLPASPNVALRHPAFRGYADYMLTDEFSIAVDHLLQSSVDVLTVVMCSESVWWRCHRRLVSDYLALVRGTEVRHLINDGTLREHRLTEGVRAAGDHIVYDHLAAALER